MGTTTTITMGTIVDAAPMAIRTLAVHLTWGRPLWMPALPMALERAARIAAGAVAIMFRAIASIRGQLATTTQVGVIATSINSTTAWLLSMDTRTDTQVTNSITWPQQKSVSARLLPSLTLFVSLVVLVIAESKLESQFIKAYEKTKLGRFRVLLCPKS